MPVLLAAIFVISVSVCAGLYQYELRRRTKACLRAKLPVSLTSWRRLPQRSDLYFYEPWVQLDGFLQQLGLILWRNGDLRESAGAPTLCRPGPNGYMRYSDESSVSSRDCSEKPISALWWPARYRDGRDVFVRVLGAGGEGNSHVRAIRKLATGGESVKTNNHVLPLLQEILVEDVVLGVFPMVSVCMRMAMWNDTSYRTSVADVLDMFVQALEGVAFIHEQRIAHRDLSTDNFLLEWHPESMHSKRATSPRLYIVGFELAIEFQAETDPKDLRVSGLPAPSFNVHRWPPEVYPNAAYSPFALDIWELGKGFEEFSEKANIPPVIKGIMEDMRSDDLNSRPSAIEALRAVSTVLQNIPPSLLHVAAPGRSPEPLDLL